MKLCKKKMAILSTVLFLMVFFVFVLCSFTLPDFDSTEYLFVSRPSSTDYDNLLSIVSLQEVCGSFNSFYPVCLLWRNDYIYLYCSYIDSTYSFVPDYNESQSRLVGSFVSVLLTEDGFTCYRHTDSLLLQKGNILCYRPSFDSDWIVGSSFVFSTSSNGQDSISEIHDYWIEFYSKLLFDSSELESIYDKGYWDGLESGLVWGEELGYQEGYTEGYQEGIGTGYRDGFLAGEAEGYDTGYADGYQDGYDTGYAEAERETVIRYVEPVELDIPRIINGIGAVPRQVLDGVDFEIFGVPILGVLLSILILTISIFVIRKMK